MEQIEEEFKANEQARIKEAEIKSEKYMTKIRERKKEVEKARAAAASKGKEIKLDRFPVSQSPQPYLSKAVGK